MSKGKILLLASFIGSGNKKAAEAVELALKEKSGSIDVKLVNFFEFASPGVSKAISNLYFKLLHSNPRTWGYLYDPREGKARVAELMGIRGLWEGARMKRSFEIGFDKEVEKDLSEALSDVSTGAMGMRELLEFLGAKPEIAEKIYDEKNDRFLFPYSLIGRKIRLLRKLGSFLYTRMKQLLLEYDPGAVVCTQVLPCMFVDRIKAREGLKVPLIAVLTDFGLHSYWCKPNVDAFVVPCPEVAEMLSAKGVVKEHTHDFGIPIDRKFISRKNKLEMREKLGFNPQLFTVLIMGGGTGFLVDLSAAVRMWEKEGLPFQLAVIAGENEELKIRLEDLRLKMKIPVFIYSFINNVEELMAASDIIITKPGGLSITESMISYLPMVLVKVIQGQEENNLRYLLKKRAAVDAGTGRKIGRIVRDLYKSPEELSGLWRRARGLVNADSASKIADLILSYLG